MHPGSTPSKQHVVFVIRQKRRTTRREIMVTWWVLQDEMAASMSNVVCGLPRCSHRLAESPFSP